jgi:hypothetical protein
MRPAFDGQENSPRAAVHPPGWCHGSWRHGIVTSLPLRPVLFDVPSTGLKSDGARRAFFVLWLSASAAQKVARRGPVDDTDRLRSALGRLYQEWYNQAESVRLPNRRQA